tara:strand:+ start:835 stop:1323 length:489 start_codon:yes stop_codon:yes gene_type:complete
MKDKILEIHNTTSRNQYLRKEDAESLRHGYMSPDEFLQKWYESFDCIGQSKLLIARSQSMTSQALTSIRFVKQIQKKVERPSSNYMKPLQRPSTAPPTSKITKTMKVEDANEQFANFLQKMSTPKAISKTLKQEKDNKYVAFMDSLRKYSEPLDTECEKWCI